MTHNTEEVVVAAVAEVVAAVAAEVVGREVVVAEAEEAPDLVAYAGRIVCRFS